MLPSFILYYLTKAQGHIESQLYTYLMAVARRNKHLKRLNKSSYGGSDCFQKGELFGQCHHLVDTMSKGLVVGT